jgi:hypothetical protein
MSIQFFSGGVEGSNLKILHFRVVEACGFKFKDSRENTS